uniref:Uncharacterized protein n=1 Tax=Avena sativa TaxID=4498 RepID=A0ACD5TEL2_AVESA
MAPRIAVAVVLVVAVAACSQLLRADGGVGVDGVVALVGSCDDGSAALGHCWMGDGLVRKPSGKYISYAALRADQIPCNMRGQSYYQNCGSMKQMNPYPRGCSAITRCARNLN